MNFDRLLADRTRKIEFSGIRKFFEMASGMTDPCDLSIGQPDYDAPEPVKKAAIDAIAAGKNRYTPSAGIPELRSRIADELESETGVRSNILVTCGVSGALTLALMTTVQPGDEVVFLDPYFVSYPHLVNMVGGTPVPVRSYPDFRFDAAKVEAAITPRTKVLLINSPANPTGRMLTADEVAAAAEIAKRNDLLLVSDEIYDRLCYDAANTCPLSMAPENTLVIRGYGKTYGVTGWRMGYAAGPERLIGEMTKFQQYTFVCAPAPAQFATLTALETDVSHHRDDYRKKRDLVCRLLEPNFEIVRPTGGFYVFPKAPASFPNATAFCERVAKDNVLVIPGGIFSGADTHFRVSYATTDAMIERGCSVLNRLASAPTGS